MVDDLYLNESFQAIWVRMSRMAIVDFQMFKLLLLLVFRSAYHLDHVEIEGRVRYQPNQQILEFIDVMDDIFGEASPPGGLLAFLNFLDLLGWNEDVKYHTTDGEPEFSNTKKFDTGRINTFRTCINVTYQTHFFVKDVVEKQNWCLDKLLIAPRCDRPDHCK